MPESCKSAPLCDLGSGLDGKTTTHSFTFNIAVYEKG